MSAEDELLPQDCWPPMDSAFVAMLAEFWDDAESDQRNLEIIDWWLARTSHFPVEVPR